MTVYLTNEKIAKLEKKIAKMNEKWAKNCQKWTKNGLKMDKKWTKKGQNRLRTCLAVCMQKLLSHEQCSACKNIILNLLTLDVQANEVEEEMLPSLDVQVDKGAGLLSSSGCNRHLRASFGFLH